MAASYQLYLLGQREISAYQSIEENERKAINNISAEIMWQYQSI
jgi:hypothetical protein